MLAVIEWRQSRVFPTEHLNTELVILPVVNQMRGRETNAVLATKKRSNTFENVGDLRLEARKPRCSSRQLRERLELVLCLKVTDCSRGVEMLTLRKADRKHGHVALAADFENRPVSPPARSVAWL